MLEIYRASAANPGKPFDEVFQELLVYPRSDKEILCVWGDLTLLKESGSASREKRR